MKSLLQVVFYYSRKSPKLKTVYRNFKTAQFLVCKSFNWYYLFLYIGSYYILCHAVQLWSTVFKTSPLSLIKYIWRTIWAFFQHHKTPENIIFINLIFLSRVYWIKDTRKCEWFKDLSLLKKKLDNPCFQTSFKLAKIFPVFFDGINYSGNKSDFLILILSACGIHPIC